ncbi:hypothetical protein N7457_009539 [Penicillium paradoxum]|uniref:uncharacterized protein n=1 Tax=Penicillium paradoxum TaxID=176176 RepID=UPI0025465927|nr:uncharacterized protein N7457_009539 [Penicillium paradoxum]KAJ5774643.1 hypothetical protein N7457_009539 [Penicillium paradoxum]
MHLLTIVFAFLAAATASVAVLEERDVYRPNSSDRGRTDSSYNPSNEGHGFCTCDRTGVFGVSVVVRQMSSVRLLAHAIVLSFIQLSIMHLDVSLRDL